MFDKPAYSYSPSRQQQQQQQQHQKQQYYGVVVFLWYGQYRVPVLLLNSHQRMIMIMILFAPGRVLMNASSVLPRDSTRRRDTVARPLYMLRGPSRGRWVILQHGVWVPIYKSGIPYRPRSNARTKLSRSKVRSVRSRVQRNGSRAVSPLPKWDAQSPSICVADARGTTARCPDRLEPT